MSSNWQQGDIHLLQMVQICSRCALRLSGRTYTKYLLRQYSNGSSAKPIQPPRILFFGSDTFSIASLEKLRDAKQREPDLFEQLHIVTREPAPSGRGLQLKKRNYESRASVTLGPVYEYAEANKLLFQTVSDRESMFSLKLPSYGFDLVVAVSFGLFIPPRLLQAIPHSINVHPSLLPQYRGAAPIHRAILNGDKHTGVTLQTLSPHGFDRGIIFEQSFAIAIEENEKFWDLWDRLANIGADMLVESIRKRSYVNPQPTHTFTEESSAPKVETTIDWHVATADRVERLSRFASPITGAIDINTGKRTLIHIRGISHRPQQAGRRRAGEYFLARERVSGEKKMVVVCADRNTIFVEKVKVSGKQWISGAQFVESSPSRFWNSRFVPWRQEYDEHDPREYRYVKPDATSFPGETNSTDYTETTGATTDIASTDSIDNKVESV